MQYVDINATLRNAIRLFGGDIILKVGKKLSAMYIFCIWLGCWLGMT